MTDNFSARTEATRIERIAEHMRDVIWPIERGDLQHQLQVEVNSMTLQQMRDVGKFIEKETPRNDAMTGYSNDIIIDNDNNVTGFIFNRQMGVIRVERKEQPGDKPAAAAAIPN